MRYIQRYRNVFGIIAITGVIAAIIAVAFFVNRETPDFIEYTVFLDALGEGRIASAQISGEAAFTFTFADGDLVFSTNNPRREDFKETLLLAGVTVTETNAPQTDFVMLGFTVILAGGIILMVRRRGGMATAKNGLNPVAVNTNGETERVGCNFGDIAGNLEAKESVGDIIDYLREPGRFARYGARMPRGILLYGKPGTGKTLMAKAMAGEAGVPFYAVSGSDFVQMYVGVGAARVRELFKKVREHGKGVIFIDEIDALGKKRGDGINGNDEREQTLNALLTEMQGFSENNGIVVVAATNRIDTLDDALLRPGRFDRRVEVGLPDINARKQILTLHARNKPLSPDTDLVKLARDTVFFSGAMLEGLLNDAAINAARRNRDEGCGNGNDGDMINDIDISSAYYTAIAGAEKKDRSMLREHDRTVTAWHESGHALTAALVHPENQVAKVTIIPSGGGVGGFCVNIPPERMYHTKRELEAQLMVNFAGRCAEEIKFGKENVTTGASNDIEKATDLILQYVTRYGFGEGILDRAKLEDKASVSKECDTIASRLYAQSLELLQKNHAVLETLSAQLLEKETLDGDEVAEIIQKNATSSSAQSAW
ncbi:MAG: ATP-dependent metallopeptidase FtsH/Yme1/Tma family protein [Defluviitaleaceae bacterium]|nr:ATP-dependent metallopeptidase FtsH/Yme1/Tma family protein [Defluviitaleaceae bacterium]